MNFFEDAVRFFSNMKKEASAKHILIKGSDAVSKLTIIKSELVGVDDLSAAFSDLAAKVRSCTDSHPHECSGGTDQPSQSNQSVRQSNSLAYRHFCRLASALAQIEAEI